MAKRPDVVAVHRPEGGQRERTSTSPGIVGVRVSTSCRSGPPGGTSRTRIPPSDQSPLVARPGSSGPARPRQEGTQFPRHAHAPGRARQGRGHHAHLRPGRSPACGRWRHGSPCSTLAAWHPWPACWSLAATRSCTPSVPTSTGGCAPPSQVLRRAPPRARPADPGHRFLLPSRRTVLGWSGQDAGGRYGELGQGGHPLGAAAEADERAGGAADVPDSVQQAPPAA
jgi:hypothetical protein